MPQRLRLGIGACLGLTLLMPLLSVPVSLVVGFAAQQMGLVDNVLQPGPWAVLSSVALTNLLLVAPFFLSARRSSEGIFSVRRTTVAQLLFAAALLPGLWIGIFTQQAWITERWPISQSFHESAQALFLGSELRTFLFVVILIPLLEELIFRGIILRGLLARYPAVIAITVSSALFAIAHLNPWQATSAFTLGLILGWFFHRTRSLWLCFWLHALNNGLVGPMANDAFSKFAGMDNLAGARVIPLLPVWLLVVGLAWLLLSVWAMHRLMPRAPARWGLTLPRAS